MGEVIEPNSRIERIWASPKRLLVILILCYLQDLKDHLISQIIVSLPDLIITNSRIGYSKQYTLEQQV
jgi:hypothetical protein